MESGEYSGETSGFSRSQKIENSSQKFKFVILPSNQSGLVYLKPPSQDLLLLFYLLMSCTKLSYLVLFITLPMMLTFFSLINPLERLINISTETLTFNKPFKKTKSQYRSVIKNQRLCTKKSSQNQLLLHFQFSFNICM